MHSAAPVRACRLANTARRDLSPSLAEADTFLGNPVGKDDSSSDGALCLSTGWEGCVESDLFG